MDAPRIQYARSEDGVSIAYWKIGSGPVLILMPQITASHVQAEWGTSRRQVFELLAQRATVVRFDCRGAGLSQRDRLDFSPEAQVRDLKAVVGALGADSAALCTMGGSAAAAVLYAGAYPDRVSHLILHFPVSFGGRSETFFDALEPLVDFDFHIHSQVMARLILGWDSPDATSYAQLRERSNTPEAAHLASKMSPRDFADFSPDVKAPTLILYKSVSQEAEQRATRAAALLAGAHLIAVPGEWIHIYPNSLGLEAILDFINTRPDAASHSAPALDVTAFRTILFTDLEAHTAMMHRLGDAKGREVLREHERISREALRAHGGTEVKTIGDSFMASFPSAQKALACAIDLQRAFASGDFAGERLRIRVGINAGEPIAEEDDLFGSSVILASRTKEKAAGGEIFVTDVVRQLVAGKGFAFTARGEMEMKGFEEPVRLYEVRWQEGGRP